MGGTLSSCRSESDPPHRPRRTRRAGGVALADGARAPSFWVSRRRSDWRRHKSCRELPPAGDGPGPSPGAGGRGAARHTAMLSCGGSAGQLDGRSLFWSPVGRRNSGGGGAAP